MTKLSPTEQVELLKTLEQRFEKNPDRHHGISWSKIEARLMAHPQKLWSLQQMENTGGEPDVIGHDQKTGELIFCDCSAESPSGRRNACYDRRGYEERVKKGIHPAGGAVEMAEEMGIELLTEEQYRELQKLGEFDLKTSSWIKTPPEIRKLGGGLYADRRYDTVFIYHNGAPSFYSARGFRGLVKV